jgi:hypothetical protein
MLLPRASSAPAPPPAIAQVDNGAALHADVDELARVIGAAVEAARTRVGTIAGTDTLRHALTADAATIRDVVQNEKVMAPAPGEVIEVFQLSGGTLHPLVHVPDSARGRPPVDGDAALLETDGDQITIVVGAPVTKDDGTQVGALAFATRLDLAAVRQRIAQHAVAATLLGLAKPVVLATGTKPGTTVMLPVGIAKDLKPWPLSLQGVVAAPQGQPAVAAAPASDDRAAWISYALWGAGGVLFIFYLSSLLRGRNERYTS